MNIKKLLLASTLAFSILAAQDVMKESMTMMEKGMSQIQSGFLNNDKVLINDGVKLVKKGNSLFTNKAVIKDYLPKNKKHMVNIAISQAKRINLDATVLELNLDNKAYVDASNAYSDMLNACSRCHAIVREW